MWTLGTKTSLAIPKLLFSFTSALSAPTDFQIKERWETLKKGVPWDHYELDIYTFFFPLYKVNTYNCLCYTVTFFWTFPGWKLEEEGSRELLFQQSAVSRRSVCLLHPWGWLLLTLMGKQLAGVNKLRFWLFNHLIQFVTRTIIRIWSECVFLFLSNTSEHI